MINIKSSRLIPKKAMISVLAVCVLFVSLVFTTSAEENIDEGSPYEAVVKGTVYDVDTHEPIEEAEMTIAYHETVQVDYTDSKGQYTFENVPICFCLKNVSASKKGYESQYKMVGVSEITYVNFSLECEDTEEEPEDPEEPEEPNDPEPDDPDDMGATHGVITGIVKDAVTDKPIYNALMTLEYHGLMRNTYTDSNGKYTFTDVPICFCLKDISVAKSGYKTEYMSVGVSEHTVVDFELTPNDTESDNELDRITGGNSDAISINSNNQKPNWNSNNNLIILTGVLGTLSACVIIGIVAYKKMLRKVREE